MVKPFVFGFLAVAVLAVIIGVGLNAVNAGGAVAGVGFMLGAAISGLIGGAVARRLPPPGRQH